ncbi:NADH-ubiquinone oxidoreductase chain 5, partial [Atta colombica]
ILLIVISPNVIRILIGWEGLGIVSYCLVIYYHNYISYNSGIVTVLCNRIGDVGILIAIKKIIALSTLRQLDLIIIVLSFGFRIIAYYHLLVHAVFKSILFIAAGAVIHLIKNKRIPYVIIRLLISRIVLRGIPFITGFYRKDLIMEIIYLEEGD